MLHYNCRYLEKGKWRQQGEEDASAILQEKRKQQEKREKEKIHHGKFTPGSSPSSYAANSTVDRNSLILWLNELSFASSSASSFNSQLHRVYMPTGSISAPVTSPWPPKLILIDLMILDVIHHKTPYSSLPLHWPCLSDLLIQNGLKAFKFEKVDSVLQYPVSSL